MLVKIINERNGTGKEGGEEKKGKKNKSKRREMCVCVCEREERLGGRMPLHPHVNALTR